MLNFSISLTRDPADPTKVVVADTTANYGAPGNPTRADVAIVAAAELLSPWQAEALEPEMGLAGYDPILFVAAGGGPLTLTRPQDGVLRVIAAVVPLVPAVVAAALPVDTAYCLPTGRVQVRGTGLVADDVALEPRAILGESASLTLPQVIAYAVEYLLWDQGLEDGLARLNLRYLMLAHAQQKPFVDLYERGALIYDGTTVLFNLRRFLDAAAVLEGGRQLLVTGGQTPDAYAPLLTGYLPALGL